MSGLAVNVLEVTIDYIELAEAGSHRFTEAGSAPGALVVQVPSCPGWTIADLVGHLGEVQAWWTAAITGHGHRPDSATLEPHPASGPDLISWWRDTSDRFLKTLRTTSPAATSWCWWNESERDT